MYVPFESLPETARVWIYQSNRSFSAEELLEIETKLRAFVEEWTAHGIGLEASYQIRYNRFIVLALNQEVQAATGCSIDASVHFIQSLEQHYGVDLLDKMNVSYKQGSLWRIKPYWNLKKWPKKRPFPKTPWYSIIW